ncbi:MAG: sigma-54-dependent Fis family transcriptional regulator [Deltaproteobacteria bacterium]|nr:sigma-54-dependent Fis family transcriptional regulator [Deltaproteobacteria bacterium]
MTAGGDVVASAAMEPSPDTAAGPQHVLVVDDEPDLANVIRYNLARRGHTVTVADSGEAALAALEAGARPDLVISDVMMPGIDGFELCRRLRARPATSEIPVLLLTARASTADRHEGFRAGCDDYLGKPFDMSELIMRVEALGRRLAWARGAVARMGAREPAVSSPATPTAWMERLARHQERFPALGAVRARLLTGTSETMVNLLEEILIQAHTPDPVLLMGETGTGKTLVADALWKLGPRAERPFRTINCAELQAADPLVVMGRLFGFGKNSGLHNVPKEGQPGLLEEAHGGTLFLDEVSRLPPQAQALLLLPAEGRPFNPAAGRGEPVTVDVKLVFATNRDLPAEARAGRFPMDLMMRIGHAIIRLPPLRERPDDVRELAMQFVAEVAAELGAASLAPAPALLDLVTRREWPGNVRELRSALRDACRRAHFRGAAVVDVEHLPPADPWSARPARTATPPSLRPVTPPTAALTPAPALHGVEFAATELQELLVLRRHRFQIAPSEAELGLSQKSRTLTNHLRGMCLKALARTAFHVEHAAEAVAGTADRALVERVLVRIHQYLQTVTENVASGTFDRLFNNLPRDYHRAMDEAIDRARNGTLPVPSGPVPSDDDSP